VKALHIIAFILIVVGGLNWGLVGAFHFNLVHAILGSMMWLENLVYILVGLSAILEAVSHKKNCRTCGMSSAPSAPSGQM
jgi:uncharacterized membrane protein YuzA (DUF378 family)